MQEELFGWILLANLMVLVVLVTIFLFTDRAHKMIVRSLLFVIFKAYKRGVYFPPFDAAIVEQAVRWLGEKSGKR